MQARRRAGLRSFPRRPLSGLSCPASDRTRHVEAGHSPPQDPSFSAPDRSSGHHIPGASDSRSPQSPQSPELRRRLIGPMKQIHRPAVTWRRSLLACGVFSAFWSSCLPKDIPQGGPVQGGWIMLLSLNPKENRKNLTKMSLNI